MPCYDERSSYEYRSRELQDKCNKLTRLLCEVMTSNTGIIASEELRQWWEQHQEVDSRRALACQEIEAQQRKTEKSRQEGLELIRRLTLRQNNR